MCCDRALSHCHRASDKALARQEGFRRRLLVRLDSRESARENRRRTSCCHRSAGIEFPNHRRTATQSPQRCRVFGERPRRLTAPLFSPKARSGSFGRLQTRYRPKGLALGRCLESCGLGYLNADTSRRPLLAGSGSSLKRSRPDLGRRSHGTGGQLSAQGAKWRTRPGADTSGGQQDCCFARAGTNEKRLQIYWKSTKSAGGASLCS